METDVDVEIQKQDFHIDLQNACWRFAQFPQARRRLQTTHRGGPNQTIKVGRIKWTKPMRVGYSERIFNECYEYAA
jgi:hypothetical protein